MQFIFLKNINFLNFYSISRKFEILIKNDFLLKIIFIFKWFLFFSINKINIFFFINKYFFFLSKNFWINRLKNNIYIKNFKIYIKKIKMS
jgi:hypothetical protein